MSQGWLAAFPEDEAADAATRAPHVWSVALATDETNASSHALLSADERERASRFQLPLHRARFVAARAYLRRLLAIYLGGVDPATIVLRVGDHGKPAIAAPATSLRFNLSHAGDHLLVALSHGAELGVDVERLDRPLDLPALAARVMTQAEHAEWTALPRDDQHAAFIRCWVRKEACLKATGEGIAGGLNRWNVGCGVQARDGPYRRFADGIALWDAPPLVGAAAALAVSGGGLAPRWMRWMR